MRKIQNPASDMVPTPADIAAWKKVLESNFNITGGDRLALKRVDSAMKLLSSIRFPVTMDSDGVKAKTMYANLMQSLRDMVTPGTEAFNCSVAFSSYKNIANLFEVQRRIVNALGEVYKDDSIPLSQKQRDAISELAGRIAENMFSEYEALCGVSETFNWELLTAAEKSSLAGKSREEAAAEVERLTSSKGGLKHLPLAFDRRATNPLTGRRSLKKYFIPDLIRTPKGMSLFLEYVNSTAKSITTTTLDNASELDAHFRAMGATSAVSRVIGRPENVSRRKKLLQERIDYFNDRIAALESNPNRRVNDEYVKRLKEEIINTPSYLDFFAPNGKANTTAKQQAAVHEFASGGYGETYGSVAYVRDKDGNVKYSVNLRLSGVRTYEDWLNNTPSGARNKRALKNGVLGGVEIKNEEDYIRMVNSDDFVEYVQSLEVGVAAKAGTNAPEGYYEDAGRYYAKEVMMCPKKNYDNLRYLLEPYDNKGKMGNAHKYDENSMADTVFYETPEGDDGNAKFSFCRETTDVPMWVVRSAALVGAVAIMVPYGIAAKSMFDDFANAVKNRPTPPGPTPETTGEETTNPTPAEPTKTPEETTGNNNPAKPDSPDDTNTPDTPGGDVTRPAPDETRKPSSPDTDPPETAPTPATRGDETTKNPSGEVTRDSRPSGADTNTPESGASPVDRPNKTLETTTELPPSRPDPGTSGGGSGSGKNNPAKDIGGRDSGSVNTPDTEYKPGRSDNNNPSSGNTGYNPSGNETTTRPSGGSSQGSGKDNSAPDKAPGLTGDRTNNTSSGGTSSGTGNSVISWIRDKLNGLRSGNGENSTGSERE